MSRTNLADRYATVHPLLEKFGTGLGVEHSDIYIEVKMRGVGHGSAVKVADVGLVDAVGLALGPPRRLFVEVAVRHGPTGPGLDGAVEADAKGVGVLG
jgi:hypothetical protein